MFISNCNLYNNIYTRELLWRSFPSLNSFKNFNKHVKYKIQQPQVFIDYNLYIVQKHCQFIKVIVECRNILRYQIAKDIIIPKKKKEKKRKKT